MTTIKILGIDGHYKTNCLKSNVLKALQELNLEVEILDVTDIDKLMNSNIIGIPALSINENVIIQQIIPEVEDLKILLKRLIPIH